MAVRFGKSVYRRIFSEIIERPSEEGRLTNTSKSKNAIKLYCCLSVRYKNELKIDPILFGFQLESAEA